MGLDAAQVAKLDLVCRKLGLAPGARLLDVGCGWGSLALHAAREYGADVVGITLSAEQAELARQRVADAGLADRIDDPGPGLPGRRRRAVRRDQLDRDGRARRAGRPWPSTSSALHDLLAPGGRLLNHAIAWAAGPSTWDDDSFIARYVFPDGELISLGDTSTRSRPALRGPRRRGPAPALRADPARLGGTSGEALGHGGGARGRGAGPRVAALHGRVRAVVRGGQAGRQPGAGAASPAASRRRCGATPGSEHLPSAGSSRPRSAVTVRGPAGPLPALRGRPRTDDEEPSVSDGPLIVQSDKTLLLEVDHPLAKECRAAIAPFAELERSPEHVHTYRVTPLALWNARAAGHDAEQVVDALVRFSRYPVPHALLVDVADTMDRFGRLTLANNPVHGLVLTSSDRAVLEEVVRSKRVAPMLGRPDRRRLDRRARLRARPAQAGAAEDRLAGRGPRRLRRRRRPPDRARPVELAPARLPAAGRRGVLGRRLGRRRPAVRRGQDAGRRRGDGRGEGDHADPGDQHRRRAAVEARADRAHLAHRGGDRRVLRRAQGDPPGHDRDLPGDHHPPEGRVPAPGPVRRAGLGPDRLRRGAPAPRADLPADRRPAVPPPARPDRHAGARGRP